MQIPETVKELHRSLSPLAAELLTAAEGDPASRQSLDLRSFAVEGGWTYPYTLQPWPLFIGGRKLDEMRAALTGLRRLLAGSLERFFGNDPERIAGFYGIKDSSWLPFALAEPNGVAGALSRADFLHTPAGFQCLEFNCSVMLAGWDLRFLTGTVFGAPWLAPLLRREPNAVYLDPLLATFDHWVTQAREAGLCADGELNVAYMHHKPESTDPHRGFFVLLNREYQRYLAQLDRPLRGTLSIGSYQEVTGIGGEVQLAGRRIHVAVEAHHPPTPPTTFLAMKRGKILLYNGPLAILLGDKRLLGLLSEAAESDLQSNLLDAGERALVRAHLPWTRVTRPGWTTYQGEGILLHEWALHHREKLVLKAGLGQGGKQVHFGEALPAEPWRQLLDQAFSSQAWILQERLEPSPLWFQTAEAGCGAGPHDVVWGLFALGERYGGAFLRMMPAGGARAVNTFQGATEGLLLEVPAHSEAGFSSSSSSQSSNASASRIARACSASSS